MTLFKSINRNAVFDIANKRELTSEQLMILDKRIIYEINRLSQKSWAITILHNSLVLVMFIGAVIISAFLTLEKIIGREETSAKVFFWIAYAFSILLMLTHKIIFGYGINKKLVLYSGLIERLNTELWKFLEKTDKYHRFEIDNNAFRYFCNKFEKLKLQFHQEETEVLSAVASYSANNNGNMQRFNSTPIHDTSRPVHYSSVDDYVHHSTSGISTDTGRNAYSDNGV